MLTRLPGDIILSLFDFLTYQEIANLRRTCKTMYENKLVIPGIKHIEDVKNNYYALVPEYFSERWLSRRPDTRVFIICIPSKIRKAEYRPEASERKRYPGEEIKYYEYIQYKILDAIHPPGIPYGIYNIKNKHTNAIKYLEEAGKKVNQKNIIKETRVLVRP